MAIKDKISVHPTHREFQDDFGVHVITDRIEEEVPLASLEMALAKEYTCQVKIGVRFRSNQASFNGAAKRAKGQLVFELYRDQLAIWNCAMNAICSGDKKAAIERMTELRESMEVQPGE